MSDLFDLLFELSNEDRMKILEILQNEPLKLSHLSVKLELPVQEISRQLSRLDKNDLVQKNVDGSYSTTSFAEQVLKLLPGLGFLSDNREYLKTHSMSGIPDNYMMQVGNLKPSSYVDDVMTQLHHSEQLIKEAEEYVWIMSDQILMSSMQFTEKALERNVEHRFIGPKDIKPPEGFYEEATKRGIIGIKGKAQYRFLDTIPILITLSEKQTSYSFPTIDKKFDYKGFQSSDHKTRDWCKRLFLHYWNSTDKSIPDTLTHS